MMGWVLAARRSSGTARRIAHIGAGVRRRPGELGAVGGREELGARGRLRDHGANDEPTAASDDYEAALGARTE